MSTEQVPTWVLLKQMQWEAMSNRLRKRQARDEAVLNNREKK